MVAAMDCVPVAALLLMLGAWMWLNTGAAPGSHAPTTELTLARGDTAEVHGISVSAGSAASIDHSDPQAWVQHGGDVRYSVPPQANRAFSVHSAHGTVRVLGTVFDLNLAAQRAQLALHEGQVALSVGPSSRVLTAPSAIEFSAAATAPGG